ncbi:hypothetical protein [Algoriphagus aquimarinus]|uniref:hypothetical protein n=1 Tax=Algoriphagus aquimarinus TaxID=237018 RepID=UPI0030D9EB86
MNNKNIYKIGLIVMILINGVLIFMMLRGPKMPPPRQNGLMEVISKKLDLDSNQKAEYFELAKDHSRSVADVEAKQKRLMKNYFEFLDKADATGQAEILEQIEELEGEKISVTYQHFEDLKSICSKDQLAHFEEIIEDVLRVIVNDQKINSLPPRDR